MTDPDDERLARLARATDALTPSADAIARIQAAVRREPTRRPRFMAATLCAFAAVAALTMLMAERAETSLDTETLATVVSMEALP